MEVHTYLSRYNQVQGIGVVKIEEHGGSQCEKATSISIRTSTADLSAPLPRYFGSAHLCRDLSGFPAPPMRYFWLLAPLSVQERDPSSGPYDTVLERVGNNELSNDWWFCTQLEQDRVEQWQHVVFLVT